MTKGMIRVGARGNCRIKSPWGCMWSNEGVERFVSIRMVSGVTYLGKLHLEGLELLLDQVELLLHHRLEGVVLRRPEGEGRKGDGRRQ